MLPEFQSGYISILYSVGSHPLQLWARKAGGGGSISKRQDEALGAPVIELRGPVPACHICCPPDPEKSLGITLPVIVLLLKNMNKLFSFEVQVVDNKGIKRRFRASNFQTAARVKPYLCTMPLRLDKVESNRGITVRARTCSLLFAQGNNEPHVLNLIDTPGHADFSFEVKRSLYASDGCVLLVDASQGPQAQTYAHLQKARDRGLPVIAALNKVDLLQSEQQLAEVKETVGTLVGVPPEAVLEVSAKTGQGIVELLEAIVRDLPAPSERGENSREQMSSKEGVLKALVFDSFYDPSKGVVLIAVIKEGSLKAGDAVSALRSQRQLQIREVGLMLPERYKTERLSRGQVGYIYSNLKNASDIHVGDTLCLARTPVQPLPGFEPPKRLVYAGLYPEDPSGYEKLKVALQRLLLTDAAVEAKPSVSQALGHGFRCGFLGALHMEVVHQRLEAEFGQRTILASPGVSFLVETSDGRREYIENATQLKKGQRDVFEPMAEVTVVTPVESMAAVDRLAFARRGERLECHLQQQEQQQQLQQQQQQQQQQQHQQQQQQQRKKQEPMHATKPASVRLVYRLPLAEILVDFTDKLLSATSGAATFDVQEAGKQELTK
ncbi:hypothetical protein Emed_007301 [Eimeria media]